MAIDPRMLQATGTTVLSGVRMLIKGALEGGAETLIGAQLGCPARVPELLTAMGALFDEKGVRYAVLPDAEQSSAAAVGAWSQGQAVVSVLDSGGLVESAPTLRRFVSIPTPPTSAWVIAFGPSDSGAGREGLATLSSLGMAVLEPALQEEPKQWVVDALAMSRACGRPVVLAMSRGIFDGQASVRCTANRYPGGDQALPTGGRASRSTQPRAALFAEARDRSINQIINPAGKDELLELGLAATGPAYAWTRQVLAELGLVGRLPVLRLGLRGPIDPELITKQAVGCRRLAVVEPPGGLLWREIASIVQEAEAPACDCQVFALLREGERGMAGLVVSLIEQLESHRSLPRELASRSIERLKQRVDSARLTDLAVPERGESPPPGSSLLDLAVVLGQLRRDLNDAQYMTEQHSMAPVDLAVIGELDEASRMLLERGGPLPLWLAMDGRVAGSGAAALSGGPALRAVALMTSRRFFSQGVAAIADAVRAGRSATFIVHTEEPTDAAQRRRRRWLRRRRRQVSQDALDMQAVIESLSSRDHKSRPSVVTLDPSDRARMRRLLERSVLDEGVRVIIARRHRGPRYYRRQRQVHTRQSSRKGYVATQQFLVHCPEAGELTPRRRIELGVLGTELNRGQWLTGVSWASADESLFRALGDPAIGLATVERSKPKRSRVVEADLEDLPPLPRPIHAGRETWRCCVCGFVGSTLDLTLSLLVEAGHAMGYQVRCTLETEGMETATPVLGHVLYTRLPSSSKTAIALQPGRAVTGLYSAWPTPGGTDLLLGTDLIESARAVDASANHCVASQGHTTAVQDTHAVPTLDTLETGNPPETRPLDVGLRFAVESERSAFVPIAQLSERLWGHQRFAAWVALGLAMQRGTVPITPAAVDKATLAVLGVGDPRCAQALRVGRKLAIDPTFAPGQMEQPERTLDDRIAQLSQDLGEQWRGKGGPELGREYAAAMSDCLEHYHGLGPDDHRRIAETAQRCVLWAGLRRGMDYARRYLAVVQQAYDHDGPEHRYELTRQVISGAGRVMLMPDETYLATLLRSPARYRRDRSRLNLAPENNDRISYQHMIRPEFDLFKRCIGFTLVLGEGALGWVSRLHVLRRVRAGWYREQRDFRDAYLAALAEQSMVGEGSYRKACEIAATALALAGRGETRRATIRAARRRFDRLLPGEVL
ncbi:MAG: hypothetical protein AAGH88_08545 [Planctomycetota bacterium]